MARLSGVPDATYEALAKIRAVALGADTVSLFNPQLSLWDAATLEILRSAFVAQFDKDAAYSLVKLRALLEPAGDSIIQLTAELLYAQQFFAASNSSDKLRNVRQVLSWMKQPIEIPPWAVAGVEFGLGDDQRFNQDRAFHLAWLVESLVAWNGLGADNKPLLDDAWRFRAFVHGTEASRGSAQPMQEAWLYMMFPETFENIASRDDKWHIREAFPHVLARQPSDNVDADLLAIRWVLSKTYGVGFHFYSNDVAVNWRAGSKSGPLPDVLQEDVLSALEYFDRSERHHPEWIGWELNGNYKFALAENTKLYPPKHIVSLATKRLKSGFSGGEQTNKYLTDRGFTIVELRDKPPAEAAKPAVLVADVATVTPSAPLQPEPRAKSPSGYPEIAIARTSSRSEPEPEPQQPEAPPAPAPKGASKREITELLRRDELQAVVELYDLEVPDRRVKEHLIDGIVRSKKVRIADVLGRLSRDRLKEICVGLDLDDTGREKLVLIARILGEHHADADEDAAPEPEPETSDPVTDLVALLGKQLAHAEPRDGWPMHADLVIGDRSHPVAIYVRNVGGSSRGNTLERRFQNPSQESPIRDDPDRYELLLGIWNEQGAERTVIVAFDPYRRMDRGTRFSLFMPLALLEQAADTGFASHENTRGETLYAFRAENVGRYVDALIEEGTWQKTRPDNGPKRPESRPSIQVPTKKKAAKAHDSIYIRPQVGMYSAFARLNYKPWFALAEFLDNAIQSFLTNRSELAMAGHEGPLIIDVNLDDNEISITDRAGGIAWQQFPRAFSPAHPPDDASGLSEFGLGMKAAACWFSKKWSVRTSALGEAVERTVSFDIPLITREGVENLPIEARPGRESDHFTVITMQDLRVHPRGRTLIKIREHLGSIYRVLTQDGTVRLRLTTGGRTEELNYEYPPLLEAPYFRHSNERSRLWRQEFAVELGEKRVTGWAGIMQTGSHSKAGFSVFRRRRLIEGSVGETYKPQQIFGTPGNFRSQRVIGEMFVEGFDVTHTKDGIQWNGEDDLILEGIHRQINSPKMPLLEQAEGHRVRKIATNLALDFGEEALTATADALSKPGAVNAMRIEAAPTPVTPEQPPPVVMQKRVFNLQIHRDGKPWNVHLELVRDTARPFYATSVVKDADGREVVTVQINLDHEFSVSYLNDNEDALQPMLRFIAALALGEKIARDAGATGAGTVRLNANQILSAISDAPTN